MTDAARIAEIANRPAYLDALGIARITITETERLMLFEHIATLTAEVERLRAGALHADALSQRCAALERDVERTRARWAEDALALRTTIAEQRARLAHNDAAIAEARRGGRLPADRIGERLPPPPGPVPVDGKSDL